MPYPDLKSFLKDHPDTKYLDVFYADLSCVIRGKRYPIKQADKVFDSGMMTPGSCFLLSVTGESTNPEGMGISDGDPDEVGVVIPHTLTPAPWTQISTAQVMLTLQSLTGNPYAYEPRNVLKRVVERFSELELRPMVAFEPEFYLLDIERDPEGNLIPPRSPLTNQRTDTTQVYSMNDVEDFSLFLDDVTSVCELQGVTIGAISGEYAPGQFEINLYHSDDPLLAADHCILFRRAVQCIARKHGFQATFMAKPYADNAGSGLHLHVSLLDESGKNILDGGGEYGTNECGSDQLFHGIGGLKNCMADSMAIFAPNVNSYNRFEPDLFVPVMPCWGYENRSVAMRIPKSPGNARRIEHRVSGADANPYLTLAAILAGIHHGITNKIDPGEPVTGNASADVDPDLPLDIERALKSCRKSQILQNYFGQDYLNTYTSCKLNEFEYFKKSGVAETKWYL